MHISIYVTNRGIGGGRGDWTSLAEMHKVKFLSRAPPKS